jgi:transposase
MGAERSRGASTRTEKHLVWDKTQFFEYPAQETTLLDYPHEVEHAAVRIGRLERSIDAAIESLPVKMRAVIEALQSLRGIAQISAVSIMAELGEFSPFEYPRQLVGYSGAVSQEHSSGERIRCGAISKAGNAHLRRITVGKTLTAGQRRSSATVTAMAWKAQHRLHQLYARLVARGKCKQQAVTALGRELLGFIWAIGVQVEREENAPLRQGA